MIHSENTKTISALSYSDNHFVNCQKNHANNLPNFNSLLKAINELADNSLHSIDEINLQPVSGGNINKASILTFNGAQSVNEEQSFNDSKDTQSSIFLKQNSIQNLQILTSEFIGLSAMRNTGARTCLPLAIGIDDKLNSSFLILSLIHPYKSVNNSRNTIKGWQDLAFQLATLHQAIPPQPVASEQKSKPELKQASQIEDTQKNTQQWYAGWCENNYIGSNPQVNPWVSNWYDFFAEYRLGQQTKMAFDNGYLDRQTVQQIEKLQHKIDQYLPNYSMSDSNGNPRPSLLHGDLWAGNVLIGSAPNDSNTPLGYLIDPASYVGHTETDLAMTRLFGGFTEAFYDTYLSYCSLDPGFTERMDIYNLYHYLNHLNLFGTSYLGAIQRIAQRFGN